MLCISFKVYTTNKHNKMEKITTTLLLKLTKSEKIQIEVAAKKQGLSVSEYMRRTALKL